MPAGGVPEAEEVVAAVNDAVDGDAAAAAAAGTAAADTPPNPSRAHVQGQSQRKWKASPGLTWLP